MFVPSSVTEGVVIQSKANTSNQTRDSFLDVYFSLSNRPLKRSCANFCVCPQTVRQDGDKT